MQKNFEACETFSDTQKAASYQPGEGSNFLTSNPSLLVQGNAPLMFGCQIWYFNSSSALLGSAPLDANQKLVRCSVKKNIFTKNAEEIAPPQQICSPYIACPWKSFWRRLQCMCQFSQYLRSELQFACTWTFWAPKDSLLENLVTEVSTSLPHPLPPKPLQTINPNCIRWTPRHFKMQKAQLQVFAFYRQLLSWSSGNGNPQYSCLWINLRAYVFQLTVCSFFLS